MEMHRRSILLQIGFLPVHSLLNCEFIAYFVCGMVTPHGKLIDELVKTLNELKRNWEKDLTGLELERWRQVSHDFSLYYCDKLAPIYRRNFGPPIAPVNNLSLSLRRRPQYYERMHVVDQMLSWNKDKS